MPAAGLEVGIDSLKINGGNLESELAEAITDCSIDRTIDGCPTLTVTLSDAKRWISRSTILQTKFTTQFSSMSFRIAQIKKSGDQLTLVFEDLIVSSLRDHMDPRKAAAGTISRVDFVKQLVAEESWIQVYVPPGVVIENAKQELTRGQPDTQPTPQQLAKDPLTGKESTWDASLRILQEIGWTRFSDGHVLWITPETYLIQQTPVATLSEDSAGVDNIDWDFDEGKPIATATIQCYAGLWDFEPGSCIALADCGVANGPWIVSKISRSVFNALASITLSKADPLIPEPEAPQVSADITASLTDGSEGLPSVPDPGSDPGGVGQVTLPTAGSASTYAWPCIGIITSPFGMRNGHMHTGIDIGVNKGTKVKASADGVIFFRADSDPGGYGNLVIIKHNDAGDETYYAHLSKFNCKEGQQVHQGDVIGESGGVKGDEGAGDSQGPHLHFEIRPGGVNPVDPMKFLHDAARDVPPVPGRQSYGHGSTS